MSNNDLDKNLYVVALINYKKEHKNIDFSNEWNLCQDYKLKNNIIIEALKKNIIIEETELYKKIFTKF